MGGTSSQPTTSPQFTGPYPLQNIPKKYTEQCKDILQAAKDISQAVHDIPYTSKDIIEAAERIIKVAKTTEHIPTLSSSSDVIQRLTDFVNYVSYHVDMRNKYTPEELKLQTSYVENLVQTLCKDVGVENPALIVNEIIRRGSYYDGSKICKPNECDYLAVLAMFDNKVIKVKDVRKECEFSGQGYYHIKVKRKSLKHPLPDNCIKQHGGNSYIQKDLVKSLLVHTVVKSLKNTLSGVKFIGFKQHKFDTTTSYNQGDISIHKELSGNHLHGPSIWLRVGGPVCTVDIDLCFCIEQQKPRKLGRSVLVFRDDYDSCPVSHWMESVVNPTDDNIHQLTPQHHQLLLLFKYAAHLLDNMNIEDYCPPSSYALRSLLIQHQQHCQSTHVGECFMEAVRYMCLDTGTINYRHNTISTQQTYRTIPDIIYPQREIRLYDGESLPTPAMLLWLIQHVRHTSDCSWWERLVDPTFINNVIDTEILYSLVTEVRSVDKKNVYAARRRARRRGGLWLMKLPWKHQDKTETILEFKIPWHGSSISQ